MRLANKRRYAKVGDIFRMSPHAGVFLWGRLIKKARFFEHDFEANLVYIYDVIGQERPDPGMLNATNLIIGPSIVNNLGWVRGYWEIIASEALRPADIRDRHLFVRYHGTGSPNAYHLVDENGRLVVDHTVDPKSLGLSGYGNFNFIDRQIRGILESWGVIPG
jgi:hypothetical protein